MPDETMPDETIPCPTCKKPVAMSEVGTPGSTFPFCSDRCRLVDLNRWLTGQYQIPAQIDDEGVGRGERYDDDR